MKELEKKSKHGKNLSDKKLAQDALAKKADMLYTTFAKIKSDVIQNPS